MKMNQPRSSLSWLLSLSLLSSIHSAGGADKAPAPETDHGPFFSGTIKANYPGKNVAMKGIVVKLGDDKKSYVCYDTDLLRLSIAWTGNYLEFKNGQKEIVHPPPPEVIGTPAFGTMPGPGWAKGTDFTDPRAKKQGPLPKDWAKYRGLYLHGEQVVFSYTVGDVRVLELPGLEKKNDQTVFTRTFEFDKSEPLTLLICESANPESKALGNASMMVLDDSADANAPCTAVALVGNKNASLEAHRGRIEVKFAAKKEKTPARYKIAIWHGPKSDLNQFQASLKGETKLPDLAALCKGGPPRWTAPVVNQGALGTGSGPYLVDTLPEPTPNPWNAKTFFGGFDFFPDGRAAVCTFHGDVWIVSGIDAKMEKLTWKRFATGLFQPLGLKIVDGKIYVTCRDQLNRLHDLNNDGEADFYENFNNDTVVTPNYHEFCMDLHTDSEGNFYYAKGAPWPPNVETPHQGTMLKVSKDGSRLEVFATGFRAPNGMGLSPKGEITVSDNQGHWMPSSKINLVKQGGFYGMVPSAQREPKPTDFDKPICWLPMSMDNSSGGQTWVTSDKWGPFKNHLLFMSYGKGTLFHIMTEEVEGVTQAAAVQLPLKFQTGIMRARFNPKDGQLYVSGLRGWQTSGVRDGGFYRVRYNGQPVHTPSAVHAAENGIEITFPSPLDSASATSPENYGVEQWNYKWTGNYGSPEFSVINPTDKKHDPLAVKSAQLSSDKKTVFLEIPELKPSDQVKIKFNISAADGTTMAQEIYSTIYRLGSAKKLSLK